MGEAEQPTQLGGVRQQSGDGSVNTVTTHDKLRIERAHTECTQQFCVRDGRDNKQGMQSESQYV